MLRPRLLRLPFQRVCKRNLHLAPPLDHFSNGIPDFLSPVAVDIAYNQYQSLMITRLNDLVKDTPFQNKNTKELTIQFARQPDQAAAFNYASMAHNNHFFFESLSNEKTDPPGWLKKRLEESFSSMESLRREFILTANAMFGPGFVWLVYKTPEATSAFQTRAGQYALLTTYLAGSPYPDAHFRRQSIDMNTQNEPLDNRERLANSAATNTAGHMGKHSASAQGNRPSPGGFRRQNSIIPLLCINTWEHVWLPDYTVAGKFQYASNWWERINWEKVAERNPDPQLMVG